MTDPVKDALRAAAATVTCFDSEMLRTEIAADCIAAFLRALPTAWARDTYGADAALFKGFMLEAVEAAREAEG